MEEYEMVFAFTKAIIGETFDVPRRYGHARYEFVFGPPFDGYQTLGGMRLPVRRLGGFDGPARKTLEQAGMNAFRKMCGKAIGN